MLRTLMTLPNMLTLARIGLLPVFVATFFLRDPLANWAALAVFCLASLTDFLDGFVARLRDEHSRFGRFLDPLADKLLVATALLMLAAFDRISGVTTIAAVVILTREFLVGGLREFMAGLEVEVRVSRLAKWKTSVQMVAIGFLLVGDAVSAVPSLEIGVAALWLAAVLTTITGFDYFAVALRYMTAEEPDADSDEDPAGDDAAGTPTPASFRKS